MTGQFCILLGIRQPVMTSPHFIQQYFTSFCEDPILKSLEKVRLLPTCICFICKENPQEAEGDADEEEGRQGYLAARRCLR